MTPEFAIECALSVAKTQAARDKIEYIELHHSGYSEPGYDGDFIALGDWNDERDYVNGELVVRDDTITRLAEILKRMGYELGWNDEWLICEDCQGLFRSSPDCYGWRMYGVYSDLGIICADCICANPTEFLEDLEGKCICAVTWAIDLDEHGYVKANDESYENGLYGGQDDDPHALSRTMENLGIGRYLFEIPSVGQFDVNFNLWVHESEAHLLRGEPTGKAKIDPATAMQMALKDAQSQSVEGDGIRYVQCNADGTADVRMVSKEEFIEGIK